MENATRTVDNWDRSWEQTLNPNDAVGFVMRHKRTKNQRVMDEKHSTARIRGITRTHWLIHSCFG